MDNLASLPWQIQLSLGSGYLAYMLAYIGIRDHHKAVDTTFRAIAFGLIAMFALQILAGSPPIKTGVFALLATLAAGLIWRLLGIDGTRWFLRTANISWADDTPSAWARVALENTTKNLTQISVLLDDGTWLNCNDTMRFADAPFGPCILGTSGDVALYVTDEVAANGTTEVAASVSDPDYGDRLTYIPASRIRRISLRYKH